jgi:hypothetical protein
MKVTQTTDGVLMEFTKQTDSKVRVLLYSEAVVSLVGCLAFAYFALVNFNEPGDYLISTIILLCVAIVFFIAFKRYLNKATAKESLLITSNSLTIINTAILSRSQNNYEIDKIVNIQFAGKQHMTDHPLKGASFDYLGFQTQQEVINTVHDEGNLSFVYDDKTVFFGKSVPSWDAEKLDREIREITKNRLYINNLPESFDIEASS